jgi:hypothetical protein
MIYSYSKSFLQCKTGDCPQGFYRQPCNGTIATRDAECMPVRILSFIDLVPEA